MTLSVRGMALTVAAVWGAVIFLTGVGNLVSASYGQGFLQVISSIYPGYKATASFGQVIIGTLYGVVDGAVVGAVFAWLYNRLAGGGREA